MMLTFITVALCLFGPALSEGGQGVQQGKTGHVHDIRGGSGDIVSFIEKEFNNKLKEKESMLKIIRVLKQQQQVVAGMKYIFQLELARTKCTKQKGVDLPEDCVIDPLQKILRCDIHVWEKKWEDYREIVKKECSEEVHPKREKFEEHARLRFSKFVRKFGKKYSSREEARKRYLIFQDNLLNIRLLQRFEMGTAKYGVTVFADMTVDEYRQRTGWNSSLKGTDDFLTSAAIPDVEVPDAFDWRDHGAVTPVKNQGFCGSCWAFSTTGNVEGQWFLKTGKLISLSEQELVDCDSLDDGCGGGLPENAYKAIKKLGGLETENAYPYDGRGEKCKFSKQSVRATVTGGVKISTNETEMAQWLVKNGPISIGINAQAMQFYFGGVSHPWKFLCSPDELDHGVLIVGFGVHETKYTHRTLPYWIVKNSWGPKWGDKGYYMVYRGDGTCGLNQMATSAVVN